MNCHEFEDILEGVLEGKNQPKAAAHLAACTRCRLLVDELVAIGRAAHDLPLVEPSARLWRRIEAAAFEEGLMKPSGWAAWLGPAWSSLPAGPAFAGVLGLTLLLAGGLAGTSGPAVESATVAPLSGAQLIEVARAELVQDARYDGRYAAHLQNVETQVREQPPSADRQLSDMVTGPLDNLDSAIAETQAHLDTYPDDSVARAELQRLYRQKATVLQAMVEPTW